MTNNVVVITGGGKGIGFGIANAFAKEGYDLVITGRTPATLENAKKELEENYGVDILAIKADGGVEEEVKNVIDETAEKFGKINVLINNAQASKSGVMLEDHTKEDFDLAINSGLYAAFFFMKYAFPYLKESEGSIINLASGAGINGNPGQSSYAAAKEGIRGLSRVATNEWGKYNINTNVVCPLVMTPQLAAWKEEYPEAYEQNIKSIPMSRFGDAEKDIGGVCLFLASDAASYLSGQTIMAQGGSGSRP